MIVKYKKILFLSAILMVSGCENANFNTENPTGAPASQENPSGNNGNTLGNGESNNTNNNGGGKDNNNSDHQSSTSSSLSDYSFIGSGYGKLTHPAQPAPGHQVPYVPNLAKINPSSVVYVSPNGSGNGLTKATPAKLTNVLKAGAHNKTIVALDGDYRIEGITLRNMHHVNLISYNKWGAKLVGTGESIFNLGNANVNVEQFSIVGFEAVGETKRYFIFCAGNAKTLNVHDIYISDMKFHDFMVTIYGGLQSHDWTVDKSVHYDSAGSYLWYMMGWHHSVINSVMYNNGRTSLVVRGCYTPEEDYDYYNHENNTLITERSKHFLADNDWTHMIVNNTFGSNIDNHNRTINSHIGIFYQTPGDEKNQHMAEDVYYPPKNILIANNAFLDKGFDHKYPINISAERGINVPNKVESVNGITIKNNYTDRSRMVGEHTYSINSLDLSKNETDIPESSFGFKDNVKRDYHLKADSLLIDKGASDIWKDNSDAGSKNRDNRPDIGAFEASK